MPSQPSRVISPPESLDAFKLAWKELPRPFRRKEFSLRLHALSVNPSKYTVQHPDIAMDAPLLKELPSALVPSNDRRIPFPPLMQYGYIVDSERFDELVQQKMGHSRGAIYRNTLGVMIQLRDVVHYNVKFTMVFCNGDGIFFIAISSNWDPAPSHRLEEVVKELKAFLEVDEEPVWCLDSEKWYWTR